MNIIHDTAAFIRKFETWFNKRFEWFFTNGRKENLTSLNKK